MRSFRLFRLFREASVEEGAESHGNEGGSSSDNASQHFWTHASSMHFTTGPRSSTLSVAWLEVCPSIPDLVDLSAQDAIEAQREALGAVFDLLDLDGNGLLERNELEALLLEAANTIHLKIDKAVIGAAVDALLDDYLSDQATIESGEANNSGMPSGFIEKNDGLENSTSDKMQACLEGMNKQQFVNMFHRYPVLLRIFEDETTIDQRRRLSDVSRTCGVGNTDDLDARENDQKENSFNLVWLLIYLFATVAAFVTKSYKYAHHEEARAVFGECIIVARGSANCINLNCALILIPMAKHFMTRLRLTRARHYFPFNHVVDIHKILGVAILFWTICHVSAHICDFHRLSTGDEDSIYDLMGSKMGDYIPKDVWGRWDLALFHTRAGITGIIMVLCIVVAYPLTLYRHRYFNVFWTNHHLLIVMLIALCFHGTGNLLEPFQSVYWLLIPLSLYAVPRCLRETPLSKSKVLNALIKPGGVLSLQLEKPPSWEKLLRPGMYALINVPHVSCYEWHPFTLTSSPTDPFLEFHIRNAGDWTNKFHDYVRNLDQGKEDLISPSIDTMLDSSDAEGGRDVENQVDIPRTAIQNIVVKVEGPIGASSQGFKDFPILVLVGAGIGVTPMVSVLKELLVNPGKMKRVFFYWTVRDHAAFEWFSELMDDAYQKDQKHVLQIRHFLTSVKDDNRDIGAVLLHHATRARHRADNFDLILGQETHHQVEVGRPNWKEELQSIKQEAKDLGYKNCGIFLCGPEKMAESIANVSRDYSRNDPHFHFHFNKETF